MRATRLAHAAIKLSMFVSGRSMSFNWLAITGGRLSVHTAIEIVKETALSARIRNLT
jgi:hypothetical protein